ncbi:MAG: hypothetical protein WAK96_13010 [Desulfobaccales bacterium]
MPEKIIESKNRCIWMDSGVMHFKLCESDFDCLSCQFDRAMTESATRQIARRLLAGKPAAVGLDAPGSGVSP